MISIRFIGKNTLLLFLATEEDGCSIKEAFMHREFYILWFCMMVGGMGMFALDMYKAFGQSFLHDDRYLAMVGASAAIFNCLGRLVWGFIVDRFKFKVSYWFMVCWSRKFVGKLL